MLSSCHFCDTFSWFCSSQNGHYSQSVLLGCPSTPVSGLFSALGTSMLSGVSCNLSHSLVILRVANLSGQPFLSLEFHTCLSFSSAASFGHLTKHPKYNMSEVYKMKFLLFLTCPPPPQLPIHTETCSLVSPKAPNRLLLSSCSKHWTHPWLRSSQTTRKSWWFYHQILPKQTTPVFRTYQRLPGSLTHSCQGVYNITRHLIGSPLPLWSPAAHSIGHATLHPSHADRLALS